MPPWEGLLNGHMGKVESALVNQRGSILLKARWSKQQHPESKGNTQTLQFLPNIVYQKRTNAYLDEPTSFANSHLNKNILAWQGN